MSKVLNVLNDEYFDWMCDIVGENLYSKRSSFRRLLRYLHGREFTYIIDMDASRAEDGRDLRYRFAYERNYTSEAIVDYLDDGPCSVLEMMVALAVRCEDSIMYNPDFGDRSGQWFWNMIISLGLGRMSDDKFDEKYADKVIDTFLNRDYERDGDGGLFTIKNCKQDLRNVEIWYQMCWYLDDICKN